MRVRTYQDTDRDSLVDLWASTFPDSPAYHEPSEVIDRKLAVDNLIYVAIEDEELIGACIAGYDGHRGWLYSIALSHNKRRTGAGSALVEHAIQSLKEMGCVKINLQVRSENSDVAAFYETLGFEKEDRVSMGLLT